MFFCLMYARMNRLFNVQTPVCTVVLSQVSVSMSWFQSARLFVFLCVGARTHLKLLHYCTFLDNPLFTNFLLSFFFFSLMTFENCAGTLGCCMGLFGYAIERPL